MNDNIDDTQAVLDIIDELRGEEEPYEHIKKDEFHVTVAFEPDTPMLDKLGTKFEVHIVGYDRELIKTEEVEVELYKGLLSKLNTLIDKTTSQQ